MGTTLSPPSPAIPKGTYDWGCSGTNFKGTDPSLDQIGYDNDGKLRVYEDNVPLTAPVLLPDGAVVTAVEVFGDAAAEAETWILRRSPHAAATDETMASANVNTEDTSISFATINNNTHTYLFTTSSLDTNDEIYGARITYTI